MRSVTILSGIAILTLAAAAQAQSDAPATPPDPGASATASKAASGDKAATSTQTHGSGAPARNDNTGYNAKTSDTAPAKTDAPPRRSKWPSYGQFSSGPGSEKPYGPPR